jgi:hypothetical protein
VEFIDFKRAVYKQFDALANNADRLYLTNVNKDELWDCYIDSYPEDERQSHTCNCCRQFIKPYGNVVAIVNNKLVSIWDSLVLDEPYATVARNLAQLVKSKPVCDVFVSKVVKLGTDKNNVWIETPTRHVHTWNHLFYKLPNHLLCAVSDSEEAVQGALRINKTVLKRALDELSMDAFDIVLDLISQGSLYRGDQYKSDLEAFVALKKKYEVVPREERDNFCWVESAKVGYVGRIRNTAIGTLLVDITNGRDLDASVSAYERIVAPANYQRPKSIVTKRMIEEAQKKVQELGLMDSLPRRHAALEDITVNNVIFANRDAKKVMAGNIFEELAADTKVNPKKFDKLTEISIDDFIANVVPTATNIEVLMESRLSNNLVTLTAPVNKDAKNLFKWPNNFAWTYNGGVADSIKEKVRAAGGQTEGFLRCSLAWSNYDDLDLHVVEPSYNEIYYSNRTGKSGGKLDVDENAGYGKTRKPVENIIWVDERKMLEGNYTVYVNNFCCRESVDTGFTLEIEYNGEVRQFVYDKPVKHKENVMVAEITYSKSKDIQIRELIPSTSNSSIGIWNIDTNKFHKVNVMMLSPNYWDEQGIGNKHYFFMLDDCKNPEPVRGFFNEYLNSELTPHRKVFEVLADKMKTPYQEHQLSGLGFSSTMRNSVIVKVDGTFSRTLKVNF